MDYFAYNAPPYVDRVVHSQRRRGLLSSGKKDHKTMHTHAFNISKKLFDMFACIMCFFIFCHVEKLNLWKNDKRVSWLLWDSSGNCLFQIAFFLSKVSPHINNSIHIFPFPWPTSISYSLPCTTAHVGHYRKHQIGSTSVVIQGIASSSHPCMWGMRLIYTFILNVLFFAS